LLLCCCCCCCCCSIQVQELYSLTLDSPAIWYANSEDVTTMMLARYDEIVHGLNNTPSAASRRRLLAVEQFTAPQVIEIMNSIGDAVAQTNARANDVLVKVSNQC
jgi:hypothetical protein